MKNSTRQLITVLTTILIIVPVVTSFTLDRISRGEVNTSVTSCTPLVFTQNVTNGCKDHPETAQNEGWPFVAIQARSDGTETFKNSFPIASGIYFSLNALMVCLVVAALYILYARNWAKLDKPLDQEVGDNPVLSSLGLLDAPDLTSVGKGTLAGYGYNVLTNHTEQSMMLISLHGNTHLHLVAIGVNSKLQLPITEKIDNNFLIPIILEGDFPEDFHIYASPDKEVEVREVLNPSVMAYLADFCEAYDLELYNDSLYISHANGAKQDSDQTSMSEDVEKLLTQPNHIFEELLS